MAIVAHWWKFNRHMIEFEKDEPGVYEFADQADEVIYIGSSHEVKQRLHEHLHDAADGCLRRNAVRYRVEYAAEYSRREKEAYQDHMVSHGKPPRCNRAASGL